MGVAEVELQADMVEELVVVLELVVEEEVEVVVVELQVDMVEELVVLEVEEVLVELQVDMDAELLELLLQEEVDMDEELQVVQELAVEAVELQGVHILKLVELVQLLVVVVVEEEEAAEAVLRQDMVSVLVQAAEVFLFLAAPFLPAVDTDLAVVQVALVDMDN